MHIRSHENLNNVKGEKIKNRDLFWEDWAFLCIQGIYEGNSFYINNNEEGDILGNSSSKDLTLSLDDSDVEEKHASLIIVDKRCFITNLCMTRMITFRRDNLYPLAAKRFSEVGSLKQLLSFNENRRKIGFIHKERTFYITRTEYTGKKLPSKQYARFNQFREKKQSITDFKKVKYLSNITQKKVSESCGNEAVLFILRDVQADKNIPLSLDKNGTTIELKFFQKNLSGLILEKQEDTWILFCKSEDNVSALLFPQETIEINVGDIFTIGKQHLQAQNYALGMFTHIGKKKTNEDKLLKEYSFMLGGKLCNIYAVFDGSLKRSQRRISGELATKEFSKLSFRNVYNFLYAG